MSHISRLRFHRGTGRSTETRDSRYRRLVEDQDPRLLLNRLFLSGVIISEPRGHNGAYGTPALLLMVAFPVPGASATVDEVEVTHCEVEIPDHVARDCRGDLRAGESIFLTGQLRGEGSVVATEIHPGSVAPPREA